MLVPTYETDGTSIVKHKSHFLGVDSTTDHSSQTQADGWQTKIQEKLAIYNKSPLAKRSNNALRLADFFAHLQGMNSDHAKDQKKLAVLLKEIKHTLMQKSLGEETLVEMSIPEILMLLTKANDEKIGGMGGLDKWNLLSQAEKSRADAKMMSAVVLKLGCEVYSQLKLEERHQVDFFI